MRRLPLLAIAAVLLALPAPAAAQSEPPLPTPTMRGDWPDPSVLAVDGGYYAVATSGGWAPTFRILRSSDLRSWSIAGSVFQRAPGWTRDSFWAPEMTALPSGGYALYYSAFPRKRPGRSWFCLGVATSPTPTGPWRDLGRPLRCTARGTIDPTPVVDGGRLYLVYKEDGNAFGKPTPILLQEMSADGRALLGSPRELIRNTDRWEGKVIEAPALLQRDGYWYMLYSANLCCSPDCAYAVGVARATQLAGPWQKFAGNPILRSGNGWHCPGHVSVVGDRLAFHAYRDGSGHLAGRQMLIADLSFAADGWPTVADGRPPLPVAGALPTAFDDRFAGSSLAPEWEWPVAKPPSVRIGGGLRLRAPRVVGARLDAGVLSRRLGSDRYTATASVALGGLRRGAEAGLAVVRGGPFSVVDQGVGVSVDGAEASVWRRLGKRFEIVAQAEVPGGSTTQLKVVASGRSYRFSISADGARWRAIGRAVRGPIDETARVALTTGGRRGAEARFLRATLSER